MTMTEHADEGQILVAPEAPVKVTTRDVLHRAADLLEEFGWCQQSAGRSSDGVRLGLYDDDFNHAVAYCRNGAVGQACLDLGVGLSWANKHGLLGNGTAYEVAFNDAPERTKAEVVARLREAAEAAT